MSDLHGISTPFRFTERGQVATARGDDKVREDLAAVLLTAVGERVMRRSVGGGIEQLVHEPDDAVTRALIQRQITVAVAQWMPDLHLRQVDVVSRGGLIYAHLAYSRRGAPDVHEVAVPVDIALR